MSPEGHGWPSESVCRCTGGFDPAVLDTGVCVCVFTAGTAMPMGTLWGHFVLGGHYQVHTEVCIFLHSLSSVVSAKKPSSSRVSVG